MNGKQHYYAGIDAGSRAVKALIWDGESVIGRSIVPTGWTPGESIRLAYRTALQAAGIVRTDRVTATGYGRIVAPFADLRVTEITAHARGISRLIPGIRTLIDVGGQDSKAILLDEDGVVTDFAMNDRCAAGCGKFLEFLALTLGLTMEDFAELAYSSNCPTVISSICTVFAETEALSLVAEGVPREDVAAGAHRSIASRVAQLAQSLNPEPPVAFTGGVGRNRCMVRELSKALGMEIVVPDLPEFTGAFGAAIIASEGL